MTKLPMGEVPKVTVSQTTSNSPPADPYWGLSMVQVSGAALVVAAAVDVSVVDGEVEATAVVADGWHGPALALRAKRAREPARMLNWTIVASDLGGRPKERQQGR